MIELRDSRLPLTSVNPAFEGEFGSVTLIRRGCFIVVYCFIVSSFLPLLLLSALFCSLGCTRKIFNMCLTRRYQEVANRAAKNGRWDCAK